MLKFVESRIKKIINLDENKLIEKVFKNKDVQNTMLDLNREQLYDKGIESDGTSTGQYRPYSIEQKIKLGQRYDHITLNLTGKVYSSMRVKVGNGIATITADMKKPDRDLEIDWPKALGLTDESTKEIRSVAKEVYLKEVRAAIR